MYKLNIEIYPYSTQGLSPRHHISKNRFNRIRDKKMEKFRCKCEACGKNDYKMELHEAGKIKNTCYIFQGFYLLCHKCHDMVHWIQLGGMNNLGPQKNTVNWTWKGNYKIRKYSRFKSKVAFERHVSKSVEEVFEFMFARSVSCDYSKVKKYGLNPSDLKNAFKEKYNHQECTRRYMMIHVYSIPKGQEGVFKIDNIPYERYLYPDKVKRYESMIYDAYYKDEEYYKNTIIAHRKAIDERMKVLGLD